MDADARLRYTETIVSVARYRSRLKTAMSTGFYSGKKGMKERISSIMDMSRKKAGAVLICGALIVTSVSGFVFAAGVPATADDHKASAVDSALIMDILLNWDRTGNFVQHDPMESQIGEEQAVRIAKKTATRLVRYLTVQELEYDMEMTVINAVLGQHRPEGREHIPIDPKFSLWEISLSEAEGISEMQMHINALTGAVSHTSVNGIKISSDAEVSLDKLLSGFVADLGFADIIYNEERYITVGELSEIEFESASEHIADSKVQAEAIMGSKPYMRDGEPFGRYAYLSFRISLVLPAEIERMDL
jgi:hypothetical protein